MSLSVSRSNTIEPKDQDKTEIYKTHSKFKNRLISGNIKLLSHYPKGK